MWLDISDPKTPVLVWQDGDRRDPDRVKSKDRMPLVEIVDIRAGQASEVLERSGKSANAELYMVFAGENRSLDVETPTPEARDWLFRKFADLFQAYSIAQQEGLSGDRLTIRVMKLMDSGAPVKAGAAPAASAPPMHIPHIGMASPQQQQQLMASPSTRGGYHYGSVAQQPPAPTPIRMSSLGPGSAFPGASPTMYSSGSAYGTPGR